MADPLTLGILAGATVVIIVAGASLAMAKKETVADRLSRYGSRQTSGETRGNSKADAKSGPISAGIDKAIAGQTFAANLARELARADLKLTVSEYIMISLMVVGVVAVFAAFMSKSLIFGLVLGAASFYLPGIYVKFRQRGRLKAFNARLSDTITMLANSLRSGYSLPQGMDMVAREQAAPVSEEFARVVREIGLGLTLEEALANLVRRVPSEDLDLMVTAINVQHEVGGNLAQILDAIGLTIRERVRIKGEIAALTATVRYSGYVVALLPIAMVIILFLLRPEYIMYLFTGVCGWAMAITAVILIITGFLAMRKIADIEV